MNARGQAWQDQLDAHTAAMIRTHGWAIQYVGGGSCDAPGCQCAGDDGGPPFAYTIGLFGLAHPELLIFGVPPATAAGLLNEIGRGVKAGEALLPGHMITFDQWQLRIIPESVPNPGAIVFEANRYYQRPDEHSVPVLQLTYADAAGRFPWDDDFAAPELQPRPGTFQA